jgi:hypothetical protein
LYIDIKSDLLYNLQKTNTLFGFFKKSTPSSSSNDSLPQDKDGQIIDSKSSTDALKSSGVTPAHMNSTGTSRENAIPLYDSNKNQVTPAVTTISSEVGSKGSIEIAPLISRPPLPPTSRGTKNKDKAKGVVLQGKPESLYVNPFV